MSNQLLASLDFARRLYGRVAMRDWRSLHAIRMCVAQLGMAVREARRDPVAVDTACRKAGIYGKRLEVRVVRLVAGKRIHSRSDQVPRWANAAAYIAYPPNGDEPPPTWRQAIRYINQRGGIRNLSNLYAGSRANNSLFRIQFDEEAIYGGGLIFGFDSENTTFEWFTPKYIFDSLECRFDLDPASPGRNIVPWLPVDHHYTSRGLERGWFGFVWLNPPYGRNVLSLWLEKFTRHGKGIALVPERTSTGWWQELVAEADLILCVNKKIPFVSRVGEQRAAFPRGSTLVAIGEKGVAGLLTAHRNGLGILLKPVPLADFTHISVDEAAE